MSPLAANPFAWIGAHPWLYPALEVVHLCGVALLLGNLVLVELLNAGWKAWRAGAITEEQWQGMGELAPGLFAELVPAAPLLRGAQRWSRRLDHPVYDCLYLALAEDRKGSVITKDQRLLSRLGKDSQAIGLAVDLEAWRV